MANRRPLVLNAGVVSELVYTDSLDMSSNLPSTPSVADFGIKSKSLSNLITFTQSSSAVTRVNKLGMLEIVPANTARFNHDFETGKLRGLSIYEGYTNYLTYSEQFDNASWVKFNVTVSANSGKFADASIVMDSVIDADTVNIANIYKQTSGYTAGTILYGSVFAKQNISDIATITCYEVGQTVQASRIMFATGTVTAGTVRKRFSNNYRVEIPATAVVGGATNFTFALFPQDRDALLSATGATYFCGTQLTTVKNAPYIQTTTAAVTKAVDLAVITGANFNSIYNQEEATIYVEFYGYNLGTSTVFSINDTTANNRIYLQSINGALTLKIVTSGVEQASLSLGTIAFDSFNKVAIAIKENDVAASINGATVVTDTSVTLPTVTQLNIGTDYAGANALNNDLADFVPFSKRLSNLELIRITS